jgi:hypothetical protein
MNSIVAYILNNICCAAHTSQALGAMLPWLLPDRDDEDMPTPAAMAPSEFIDKCKSFAQHLNSSPDFACAKPTPCPFIVTVVDTVPSATPVDGSRGADARTTSACTVHIGQAHHTETLRDDWRGCALEFFPTRTQGAEPLPGSVCLRLLVQGSAPVPFSDELLGRITTGTPTTTFSSESGLLWCSVSACFVSTAPAVFRTLLKSSSCSGAYVYRASNNQLLLLGSIGRRWFDRQHKPVAITTAVSAGSSMTASLHQAHLVQLTLISLRCIHWIVRGDARSEARAS